MIVLLLLTQDGVGKTLIEAAAHMLGGRPPQLAPLSVDHADASQELADSMVFALIGQERPHFLKRLR